MDRDSDARYYPKKAFLPPTSAVRAACPSGRARCGARLCGNKMPVFPAGDNGACFDQVTPVSVPRLLLASAPRVEFTGFACDEIPLYKLRLSLDAMWISEKVLQSMCGPIFPQIIGRYSLALVGLAGAAAVGGLLQVDPL